MNDTDYSGGSDSGGGLGWDSSQQVPNAGRRRDPGAVRWPSSGRRWLFVLGLLLVMVVAALAAS
ncbi:hypothetical protein [Kitasatospora sp. MBT63]|uniref:hypothetical protein n=1 Tax=Kitasatospora sp. MBT63 TaxID=1444768 RepID=UPI000539B061|nr:hypothetical protein [Kitasatospora sp. MBT63]